MELNWPGDNRKVFEFLKDKTFGTTAWHTIKCFERAGRGREEFSSFDCPLPWIQRDGAPHEGG